MLHAEFMRQLSMIVDDGSCVWESREGQCSLMSMITRMVGLAMGVGEMMVRRAIAMVMMVVVVVERRVIHSPSVLFES